VTVARMIRDGGGLAVLTAYGSTAISRFSADVYASPDAYKANRPGGRWRLARLHDPLVVNALEAWGGPQGVPRRWWCCSLVAAGVTAAAGSGCDRARRDGAAYALPPRVGRIGARGCRRRARMNTKRGEGGDGAGREPVTLV